MRTPPPSLFGNGWTDCAENWCVIRGSLAIHFTQDGDIFSRARVTVQTFKHIHPLPLAHRLKGALLVKRFYLLWRPRFQGCHLPPPPPPGRVNRGISRRSLAENWDDSHGHRWSHMKIFRWLSSDDMKTYVKDPNIPFNSSLLLTALHHGHRTCSFSRVTKNFKLRLLKQEVNPRSAGGISPLPGFLES